MDPTTTAARRDRLAARLGEEDLDLLLVSNPINVTYLTGFSGESSYLLIGRDWAVLVSDGRAVFKGAHVVPNRGPTFE